MESPDEPLISDNQRRGELLYESPGDHDGEDVQYATTDDGTGSLASNAKAAEARPGAFVLMLTFSAGISGLLFGYDTGVVSATLVSLGTSLSDRTLTSLDKSIITSATSLFALFLSPFSSLLADKLGRKRVMLYADVLFVAGALVQALSSTVGGMVAGRCIVGAAIGAASFVVPLYIAEVAPASHRGRLVTTNVLFITMGQMVAYVAGWAFTTVGSPERGWRWLVGLGALPAVLQGGLVLFMPETPRWLVKMGRSTEARVVVQRVNGGAMRSADAVVKDIEVEAREEDEARRLRSDIPASSAMRWLGPWQELMREGKNRRALTITCLLHGLQQLCGFNSLMYFSATIFALVGFKSPTLTSLTVAVTNFIFTLVALGLIDRVGRRRVLLYSIPFMICGLLLSSFGFSSLTLDTSSEARDNTLTVTTTHNRAPSDSDGAGIILFSIMVYVAAYALGLGNVPWMQSELFPLSVRAIGSGVATATNWAANFAVGLTFLPLMDWLGPPWTFALYAGICGAGYALVWRIYPETAGLSLEEATTLLDDGWGVR